MEPPQLLQTVIHWPLHEVEAWLGGLIPGEPVGGEDFNWHGFAFAIADRARHERSVAWAHLALRVYEGLAEHPSGGEGASDAFLYSAMNLRAWMMVELGVREGDAVLDPEPVVAWFQRTATLPLDAVVRWCSVWHADPHAVPPDTLRTLRAIKNTLRVLAFISEAGALRRHPELDDWLRLRRTLP